MINKVETRRAYQSKKDKYIILVWPIIELDGKVWNHYTSSYVSTSEIKDDKYIEVLYSIERTNYFTVTYMLTNGDMCVKRFRSLDKAQSLENVIDVKTSRLNISNISKVSDEEYTFEEALDHLKM